jgi:hypothetical protein
MLLLNDVFFIIVQLFQIKFVLSLKNEIGMYKGLNFLLNSLLMLFRI